MKIVAIIVLLAHLIAILAIPGLLGKPREPLDYKGWLVQVGWFCGIVALCGSVLGWW